MFTFSRGTLGLNSLESGIISTCLWVFLFGSFVHGMSSLQQILWPLMSRGFTITLRFLWQSMGCLSVSRKGLTKTMGCLTWMKFVANVMWSTHQQHQWIPSRCPSSRDSKLPGPMECGESETSWPDGWPGCMGWKKSYPMIWGENNMLS